MAPMECVDQDGVEQQVKDLIQIFYNLMVQTTNYDTTTTSTSTPTPSTLPNSPSQSRPSRDVIAAELRTLSAALQAIAARSNPNGAGASLPKIPPELIHQYVDGGRNPDIYTREFVELVRRGNQLMHGKQAAFAGFRDVLAAEITNAMPELAADAARVVAATGGGRGTAAALRQR
ncbi:mediator complex, subunit Med10 [Whalleya microplaca]|nr:mediator complex, subunit Med10 [Whalleya microplaca]